MIRPPRVHFILKFRGAIVDLCANSPAIAAVVPFAPPAIQYAQIDSTIRSSLHSAGSTRLQGTQRMVQPEIDTLHQAARDVAVVVLQKNDAIFQTSFVAKSINFLD